MRRRRYFELLLQPSGGSTQLFINEGTGSQALAGGGPDEEVHVWFGARAGQTRFIEVGAPTGIVEPFDYDLTLRFTSREDPHEPSSSDDPSPIALGETVTAYMIGLPSLFASGLADWFTVPLAEGTATFQLLSAPENVTLSFQTFFDTTTSDPGFGTGEGSGPGQPSAPASR